MKSEFCGGECHEEFHSFCHGIRNCGSPHDVGNCVPEKEIYNWATGRGYTSQEDLNDIQGD
jgi:hypothetical protein